LIIADNVVQDGKVTDRSNREPNVQGMRKFNNLLATDARLSATAIQMVGSKGWDGFAVALVTTLQKS